LHELTQVVGPASTDNFEQWRLLVCGMMTRATIILFPGDSGQHVYHGERGLRTLMELARSYPTITKDLTRVMNRLNASDRRWAIHCMGMHVITGNCWRKGF
jgi:hypothetical protein